MLLPLSPPSGRARLPPTCAVSGSVTLPLCVTTHLRRRAPAAVCPQGAVEAGAERPGGSSNTHLSPSNTHVVSNTRVATTGASWTGASWAAAARPRLAVSHHHQGNIHGTKRPGLSHRSSTCRQLGASAPLSGTGTWHWHWHVALALARGTGTGTWHWYVAFPTVAPCNPVPYQRHWRMGLQQGGTGPRGQLCPPATAEGPLPAATRHSSQSLFPAPQARAPDPTHPTSQPPHLLHPTHHTSPLAVSAMLK